MARRTVAPAFRVHLRRATAKNQVWLAYQNP